MTFTENLNFSTGWGGQFPLLPCFFYLSQFLTFFSGETYPTTPKGWFELFQRNKILGLFFLNALDIISMALVGLMFLALYVALKKTDASSMAVAAFLAFLGVAVFVSSRADMVSATLALSDQYADATTEAQRSQTLAAGQAIQSLSRATPETVGFLFIAVAGLITSVVILQGQIFRRSPLTWAFWQARSRSPMTSASLSPHRWLPCSCPPMACFGLCGGFSSAGVF